MWVYFLILLASPHARDVCACPTWSDGYRTCGEASGLKMPATQRMLTGSDQAKMTDGWVNSMSYTRIRFSGTGTVKSSQYV